MVLLVFVPIKINTFYLKNRFLLQKPKSKIKEKEALTFLVVQEFDGIYCSKNEVSFINMQIIGSVLNTLFILELQSYPYFSMGGLLLSQVVLIGLLFNRFSYRNNKLILLLMLGDYLC